MYPYFEAVAPALSCKCLMYAAFSEGFHHAMVIKVPSLLTRQFWTPLLVFSGGLLLISSLFLLFDLKSHPIKLIHEWGGIVFIVSCAAHIMLNYKPLCKILGSRAVALTLLVLFLIFFLIIAFSDFNSGDRKRHGQRYNNQHQILRSF